MNNEIINILDIISKIELDASFKALTGHACHDFLYS